MGCQRPASLWSPECCELSRDATLCAQQPAESGTEAATAAERLPQAPGWARGPGLGGNLQFSPGWIAKVEPTGLLMCKKRRDSTNSSFGPELQQRAISIPGSAQSAKRSFCCDRQPGKTHDHQKSSMYSGKAFTSATHPGPWRADLHCGLREIRGTSGSPRPSQSTARRVERSQRALGARLPTMLIGWRKQTPDTNSRRAETKERKISAGQRARILLMSIKRP
ncbi:uncharacterized protein LOC107196483 [Pteropus alecto]|uniref:uncharacterized protein LOC107196483 n=1 Tax=Pteropus alecto TaxID=9402 RepID=UPI0007687F05|nr:uncharacterized protein LOC107196483 [Pteropus alecto]